MDGRSAEELNPKLSVSGGKESRGGRSGSEGHAALGIGHYQIQSQTGRSHDLRTSLCLPTLPSST